jgi:hypothetical protein
MTADMKTEMVKRGSATPEWILVCTSLDKDS